MGNRADAALAASNPSQSFPVFNPTDDSRPTPVMTTRLDKLPPRSGHLHYFFLAWASML